MTAVLNIKSASVDSANSNVRSRSAMSFGFICAVRFIAYRIFYYYFGMKDISPKGILADSVFSE